MRMAQSTNTPVDDMRDELEERGWKFTEPFLCSHPAYFDGEPVVIRKAFNAVCYTDGMCHDTMWPAAETQSNHGPVFKEHRRMLNALIREFIFEAFDNRRHQR